ncbi:MAG TPA: hypothetical protein VGP24_14155 [Glaciihabitans sp.]|jgi:hypothetical protein|nr:hypothetical protein [Glaciihabitans sp.]
MNLFRSKKAASLTATNDSGSGRLKDYRYDLIPVNKRVIIQLAGSDEFQDEISALADQGELQAFVSRRTIEEERTDAPVAVRIFTNSRMSGVVGFVPRGLENVVLETLPRLENAGKPARIPAVAVSSKHGLRVNLLMGATR